LFFGRGAAVVGSSARHPLPFATANYKHIALLIEGGPSISRFRDVAPTLGLKANISWGARRVTKAEGSGVVSPSSVDQNRKPHVRHSPVTTPVCRNVP
jgi:hypothetical protein